jgi:hypothetical protein
VEEQAAISLRYSLSIPDPIIALSEEADLNERHYREQV